MDELWFFSSLFEKLVIALGYGQYPELMELMQINQMKSVRARQLYDAEITTPAQLAQLSAGIFLSMLVLRPSNSFSLDELHKLMMSKDIEPKMTKKQAETLIRNASNLLQIQLDKIKGENNSD